MEIKETQQREKIREDQSHSLPFQNTPLYIRHGIKRLTSKCASHTLHYILLYAVSKTLSQLNDMC